MPGLAWVWCMGAWVCMGDFCQLFSQQVPLNQGVQSEILKQVCTIRTGTTLYCCSYVKDNNPKLFLALVQ